MSSSEKYFICEELLSDGVTREVKAKGLKTLIDYGIKWKDGEDSQLTGLKSMTEHEKCKKFTQKKEVLKISSQDSKPPQCLYSASEISNPGFWFSSCLSLSWKAASDWGGGEGVELTVKLHRVETLHVNTTILKAAEKRKDVWGKNVNLRIGNVVNAEARYCSTCMKNFTKPFLEWNLDNPKILRFLKPCLTHFLP